MGFVVLIAVGGILGWLASILGRADDARGIALNIGVGVIAALVAGALSSEGSLLVGVSPTALLLALVISAAVLGGFNVARGALSR
jgi:uncharacterized membrane protein YeaQ/YmgE (transglycosylase-associated protein family)